MVIVFHYFRRTNQRPPAERGPGPFEGPASYPQLCWWSLIMAIKNIVQNLGLEIINVFRTNTAVFMDMPFSILSDNHQIKSYIRHFSRSERDG
jgi:hypothetical protein